MKRVWVVEDDGSIVDLMAAMLVPAGYEVVRMEGSEVVGMAKLSPPDVVIVDLWMRTMRGEQVVAYLRSQPEAAHTPIIICSALREGEARSRQLHTYWLDKPFGMDELIDAVKTALDQGVKS